MATPVMDLAEWKARVSAVEQELANHELVLLHTLQTPHGALELQLSSRFFRLCRKGRVWKSVAMLTALKNARYGLDPQRTRSRGGSDGIFVMDRDFKPINPMMVKLFDRFFDKPDPLLAHIQQVWRVSTSDLLPVRVVSHQMRLLGVMHAGGDVPRLVLVDYDDS